MQCNLYRRQTNHEAKTKGTGKDAATLISYTETSTHNANTLSERILKIYGEISINTGLISTICTLQHRALSATYNPCMYQIFQGQQ
jgi:hypothetical protein